MKIRPVITVPTFLLVTFGYAGYSAVTAGFAFYGSVMRFLPGSVLCVMSLPPQSTLVLVFV